MKVANIYYSFEGFVVLSMLVSTTSCNKPIQNQSSTSQKISSMTQNDSEAQISSAPLRYDRKSDIRKVDWEAFYQSGLQKYGINDFSTKSLIDSMDNNKGSVRFFSESLLGIRKERSAIPRLEKALSDKSLVVQIGATKALLQMDNRKGIKVLEEFCAKVSKEFEQGNYERAVDMSDAARVLAEAGEVSAIPYLRQLLHYEQSWGVRITAVRSLEKLYEKEPSVLPDIASMANDEKPQVRSEASKIIAKIKSKK